MTTNLRTQTMRCKVDLDELHLAETHIILQEMLEEGLIKEVDLGDGKVGYINNPELGDWWEE